MDQTTPFIYPGDEGSKLKPSSRYENFIGGDWQKPKSGKYFENISPTSGKVICEGPRSNAEDIDFALVKIILFLKLETIISSPLRLVLFELIFRFVL